MLKDFLKYHDLSNCSTNTYKIFDELHTTVQNNFLIYKRLYDFEIALTNRLQSKKTISIGEYHKCIELLNNTTKSPTEIMNEVFDNE